MAGLYLHVPFCSRLCDYCDFARIAETDAGVHRRYVAALRADLERIATRGPRGVAPPGDANDEWPSFDSVFVGGGTPTLIDPHDLGGVLRHARDLLPVAEDAEVTVEANPETVTVEKMTVLAEAGVNRVSMGAQSFSPHVLDGLGRWHDVDAPLRALAATRKAGIARVNLDLIYGTPAETDEDWAHSLRTVVEAGADHVSAYALTVEPNTGYAARISRGEASPPDDDVQAERMAAADEVLDRAGLTRYELSNWARAGQECRHNLTYWRGGDWLAVGAGAHGHWRAGEDGRAAVVGGRGLCARRWWNLRPPGRYADAALAGDPTTAGEEILDAEAQRTERLLLGLRMVEGVARADVEPLDEAAVASLRTHGLLTEDGERLVLTPHGFAVANAVTLALLG